ncbi:MAG: aldo/keto reductase [Rhodospirillaceae bacterium]|nr:MAG: aldo/keto reductase [Rhodospirillaceae bacterium]
MEKRNVGKSGLRVSAIGLGCNNFGGTIDASHSEKIIRKALDLGITLFDTAPVYGGNGGSEVILGAALGNRRKDAVIVTKFGITMDFSGFNTSRSGVMAEIEASLTRLKTDYIDLYMIHWPDASTPLQETLRALDDIVASGKARYIGVCNLPAWQVVESKWISKTDSLHEFIVSQNEYSLVQRDAENSLIPALKEYGMGFMPYSPLGNGLLTGKYSVGAKAPADSRLGKNMWNMADVYLTESKLKLVQDLGQFAQQCGHSILDLATSWLLSQPIVCSVIGGATKVEQLEQNAASGKWRLTAEEHSQVDEICRNARKASAR